MSTLVIVVDQCVKHFRTKTGVVKALDGASWTAQPGEVFALLGINGAGKTTNLRILSTILQADSGHASVNGLDVVRDNEKVRASIGFLSTSTALYGRLTPRETLRYFGQLYGLQAAEVEKRIAEAVAQWQMEEFIDRLCDKLSTGQKQRVSIARATLHDPPVLFFDEPTAGLDVVMSQTILEFIEQCKVNGKTVVFSTHIMSEVERLADHVAVIQEGVIKGTGTPRELIESTGEATMEKAFLKLVGYQSEVMA